MEKNVEFENDRVRVLRIKHSEAAAPALAAKHDRVIIYLTDGHISRIEGGRREEIRRKSGDVVWRGRSQHQIESLSGPGHEVIIVELK